MASQITSLAMVYSTVYSGVDQRKLQSSATLAFARGIHRGLVNSPHKGPVTRKMFPFDDVIMQHLSSRTYFGNTNITLRLDSPHKGPVTRTFYILSVASLIKSLNKWQRCPVVWNTSALMWLTIMRHATPHDDVIKWKHFPRYWPFVREFTGPRWIPHAQASDAELWCFLWSIAPIITSL